MFSPELLERLKQGPANFVPDLYEPMIAKGETIASVSTRRRWHDLGTPQRYLEGVLAWGRKRGWVSPHAEVARGVKLRRAVAESGVRVEAESEISGSVLLEGARIGKGSRVRDSIIGPGVELPANTSVDGRMVTVVREGDETVKGASVLVAGLRFKEL